MRGSMRRRCRLSMPPRLLAAPREIGLRALAQLLMSVSGAGLSAAIRAAGAACSIAIGADSFGRGATLHGCRIGPRPKRRQAIWRRNAADRARKGRGANAAQQDNRRVTGLAIEAR